MNETIMRRLLRAAASISVFGALIGAAFQWSAVWTWLNTTDPQVKENMRDAGLTVTVFWAMLWIGLPIGTWTYRSFLGWPEKIMAYGIAAAMVIGAGMLLS